MYLCNWLHITCLPLYRQRLIHVHKKRGRGRFSKGECGLKEAMYPFILCRFLFKASRWDKRRAVWINEYDHLPRLWSLLSPPGVNAVHDLRPFPWKKKHTSVDIDVGSQMCCLDFWDLYFGGFLYRVQIFGQIFFRWHLLNVSKLSTSECVLCKIDKWGKCSHLYFFL